MSIKLLIADDEDIIRNGVSKYIQLHTNRFDKIYEAADGQQALKLGAKDYLLKPVRAYDILKLLNELADTYIGKEEHKEELQDQGQMNHFVYAAREYIEEHYSEDLTLTGVAEQVGISPGYLSMMLSQTLGIGFVDYLTQVRIDHACMYLEQNSLKNYEIAYRVGFRDEKYFSRVFKKLKGQSPREYRLSTQKG